MNAKKAKAIRKTIRNWREAAYREVNPRGKRAAFRGALVGPGTIELTPQCGKYRYRVAKG